ncbi:beta-lactamase hydrolase domain-containing protein [Wenzhouxiangella marina]|uniref:Uncharacterized protein n=1 Tax=Wenzhouxiangella marina TaxID=1579979 RepID=A0A0K0XT90_9GAMM|nr:sulfur transferase domain-containing protein [Wenzhouxiangella marina]AKS40929.1 hypothetical protein WM2015_547 [Wenzhouxiangella marina]MBB6087803.1 protein tyrosine phosphatase (PTP) superfamily phosphohydrolase (DUF442 family) [Wenzhouxiangella marina]
MRTALCLLLFCSSLALADQDMPSPALADYLADSYRVEERIVIGGQPSAPALQALSDEGIQTVINFRTRSEVEGLDFDEPALLAATGVDYHEIGIGRGEGAYSPAVLEEFNARMNAAGENGILLHCGSGYRASQVYAAWLVKYRGLSPNEALERVSPSGWWPMPMEQLLGQPLSVEIEEG